MPPTVTEHTQVLSPLPLITSMITMQQGQEGEDILSDISK